LRLSDRWASGVSADGALAAPDREMPEEPKRRQFSPEYRLRILREADGCRAPGEVGALLRREGLYSSHLTLWRRQRSSLRSSPMHSWSQPVWLRCILYLSILPWG